MVRITAEEATENRAKVLEAAGRLFRRDGFHGASLDEIAQEAGFSKGVIYSQFGSKDELFLALIEERMEWRQDELLDLVGRASADQALGAMWDQSLEVQLADVPWTRALLEFRLHAARTPEINQVYARLHARSLERLAHVFETFATKLGLQPQLDFIDLACFLSALDTGGVLERAVDDSRRGFELSRRAVWLLLTQRTDGPGPGRDA